jgi:hypothetical protein
MEGDNFGGEEVKELRVQMDWNDYIYFEIINN